MTAAPELEVQAPATLWVPPGRLGSYGDEIIDWATSIGIPLDPEQRRDLDVFASYGPGGHWLTLEQCYIEGRQNGKTMSVMLSLALADLWLFGREPDVVMWTSHLMSTSMAAFKRVEQLIEGNGSLSRRVKEIRQSKSEQAVVLVDGSEFVLRARGARGGRGLGGKRVVMDEALYVTAGMMGALMPVMSARSGGGRMPQLSYASSAGIVESGHLRSLQRRGRAGGDPSLTMIEYRAPGSWRRPGCVGVLDAMGEQVGPCTHLLGSPGCTLDREDYWRRANHAMGRGRIGVEFVRAERRTLGMTPEEVLEFGRERLGWEETGPDDEERKIELDDWARLGLPAGYGPGPLKRPVFYLDVAPQGRAATIGVGADRVDGSGAHLELASHQVGTNWLVDRVRQLKATHPEAIFGGSVRGGIKAYLPALAAAGIRRHTGTGTPAPGSLVLLSDLDLGAGAARLQRLVAERPARMTHSADPLFRVALAGADTVEVGDGMWLWERRGGSTVELSPLYGITGAVRLLEMCRPADYDLESSVY